MTAAEIEVEYIRPGKDVSHYVEDLVEENNEYVKTFKRFPAEVAERLNASLRANGLTSPDQFCACITKVYFFHEHFNLLVFQDEHERTLGYYSDVGTPLTKAPHGYQMTDWFLDIWLSPDGTLFELDVDEFEEAVSKDILSAAEAETARDTFGRLIDEVKQGIYPGAYLK